MRPVGVCLLLVALMLLAGCTATGRLFSTIEPAPADKGVVYFYRPGAIAAGWLNIMLYDNSTQISRIQNGQFIVYFATPGRHRFYTDTIEIDRAIDLDVSAGETYFARLGLRQGMWSGTWALKTVNMDEAVEELKVCCEKGTLLYEKQPE